MSRQAPLSLVELSDAVRALQLDSKNRGEQCDEAKRLSQDAHQRMGELRKRIDKLELRCERLEESFKKGVGVQLAKLQDDMSRAQSDVAALHGSVSTVRQAQERSEYVLRQAAEDSRALGLAVSELGHVKQSVQLQQVVNTEQTRVLTDARSELGELQQRQAALVNDAAAYKAEAIKRFDALDEYVRHGELGRGVSELQQTSEKLMRLARRHEQTLQDLNPNPNPIPNPDPQPKQAGPSVCTCWARHRDDLGGHVLQVDRQPGALAQAGDLLGLQLWLGFKVRVRVRVRTRVRSG